jgi:hypothetical protein
MKIFFKKRIILMSVSLFFGWFVFGLDVCLSANVQTKNALIIEYLDDFPGDAGLDSRYKEVDKYMVYKYVKFSFKESVTVNSVGLKFIVDNSWYEKNKVKDVIFLKFNNGSWSRVGYNSKSDIGGYSKYEITSNSIGQYWAIIGVLPEGKIAGATITKTKTDYKKIFNSLEYTKSVQDVIDVGENMLITLKDPIKVKGASTIATTTATISAVTLLTLLNGPASLLIVLQQIGIAFLGLFSLKKKHRSGVVYDANTGIPISLVRVDLVDKKSDRIKETRFTDKNGRYYFLAPEGEYYLELRKKGYKIVKSNKAYLVKALLHKSDIKVEVVLDDAGIIRKNIALVQSDRKSHGQVRTFLSLVMKYLIKVAFFAGIIISTWSCYTNPTLFNFFILGIYVLILAFNGFFAKNPKYGTIVNINNKPEPFASINLLDAKTKKIISRVISDTNGRYYILLEKGEYILNVKTVDGVSVRRKIKTKHKSILAQKLVIQK